MSFITFIANTIPEDAINKDRIIMAIFLNLSKIINFILFEYKALLIVFWVDIGILSFELSKNSITFYLIRLAVPS